MFAHVLVVLSLTACVSFLLHDHDWQGNSSLPTTANETCSIQMYGYDKAAYWACAAQFAHQSNWFPSPIAGLYSYEAWNGYTGFWQNGVVIETMVNFVAYTNKTNRRFLSVIKAGRRSLDDLLKAYGPYPSFDDMGWYGLAFTRIHEVLDDKASLQDAVDILDWCWSTGWDDTGTCSGGFWFDDTRQSKQTITNVLMLQLAARLYRHTNRPELKDKMDMIYQYIVNNQLINMKTHQMSDGAWANCTGSDVYGPTYNAGVMIGALAEMYKIMYDDKLITLAIKMAIATFDSHSDDNGVLVEYCEPNCNGDGIMFKGIFVRNIRYLMDVLDDKLRAMLQARLLVQINSNVKHNLCDKDPITKCNISFADGPSYYKASGPVFSPHLGGPFTSAAPMQQTSVMSLFIAAIAPGTTCTGKYCDFDPYFPPPKPLTCDDDPCPRDRQCCYYRPTESHTCCAKGQMCFREIGLCV